MCIRDSEGMWLVSMLNRIQEAEMKNLGLNLSAQEIYDINNCLFTPSKAATERSSENSGGAGSFKKKKTHTMCRAGWSDADTNNGGQARTQKRKVSKGK